MLYLVLPQTQGAKVLYLDYLEPYITHHERQIDDFITNTHAQLQSIGFGYINVLIEFVRERILRQQSPQAPAHETGAGSYASYTNDFLSRFLMPQARPSESQPVGGIYGALSGMAATAMGGAQAGRLRGLSDNDHNTDISEKLKGIQDPSQRANFISTERERLQARLRALESEQQNTDLAYGQGSGMAKSRSTHSFVNVDHDEFQPPAPVTNSGGSRNTSGSGWGQAASAAAGFFGGDNDGKKHDSSSWSAARDITAAISSGLDRAGEQPDSRRR